MMRALRDKKTMHVVLWFLVAVFVGSVFFVFGMKYTAGAKNDPNLVAKVGDDEITREEFNKTYQPLVEKIYASEPEGPTSEESQHLQEQVLDTLVDNLILESTARKLNISVSDEELAATIRRQPYFMDKSGNFDKEKYAQVLQLNQMTIEQFEASQRQDLLVGKIRSVLLDGILFTPGELDNYISLLNRDLKAVFVVLDESAYEKNINPTQDELREFYENTRSQYDHPEKVKIRHIFLAPAQNEGFQNPETAQKSLDDYRQQVLSGRVKFQDLAKKYSQDEQTKQQGGEIGWIDRGTLPKEMEDNIFGLKKGEITKPFKLQNGYDIAQIEDHKSAYKSTFAEVRVKVEEQYRKQKATEKMAAISQQLAGKLKGKDSLAKAAQELGLIVTVTDWFDRNSGIPHIAESKDAATQLAGLYPQEWKGPLSIHQKDYFFQITDAREGAVHKTPTDQEKDEMNQRMNYERQQTWLQDFLSSQRKKMGVKTFLNG